MSNTALITITSLNLVVSGITLGGLIYAGIKGRRAKAELEKKIELEVKNVKFQANSAIRKTKAMLDSIEL